MNAIKCLALCLTVLVGLASADTDRATVTGTVKDPSTAVVPNVVVRIEFVTNGYSRTTVTASDGSYSLAGLPFGRVTLTFEKLGFRTAKYNDVDLAAGQVLHQDVRLDIASAKEAVDVRSAAPAFNESSAELGSVVETDQITNIPLNGRNWQGLMALVPGAINFSTGDAHQIRFAGHGADDNNFQFDGVDATGIRNQAPRDDLRLAISLESIAEFRVRSAQYTAESGDTTGAQVNVVSRSGSNGFHGSLFEYLRNDKLNARSPFDPSQVPPFRLNEFGGSLGGPIQKNRTFFFLDYEGLRQRLTLTRIGFVPSDAYRAASLKISPEIAPLLSAYPRGTSATANPDVWQWQGPEAQSNDQNSGLVRVDHQFSDRATGFARFTTDRMSARTPLGDSTGYLNVYNNVSEIFTNGVVQFGYVFSPNAVNDVRLGVNRVPYQSKYDSSLLPALQVAGFSSLQGGRDAIQNATSFTFVDNFTRIIGRHTLKTGVEIRPLHFALGSSADGSALTYANPAALQKNVLSTALINGYLPTVGVGKTQYFGYVQDEMKVSPSLTLNVGLRYEFLNVLKEDHDRDLPFNIQACGGYCASGSEFTKPATKDFAPRLGLAWRPIGPNTVVRAGIGMYYGEGQLGNQTSPVENLTSRVYLTTAQVNDFSQLLQPVPPAALATVTAPIDQQIDRKDMYTTQWSFSIQQTVFKDFVAEANYVGSEGAQLFLRYFVNGLNPATGMSPLPQFGILSYKGNGANSSFHALQLSLHTHARRGLTFGANYQWSHAIDQNAPGGDDASAIQNTNCRTCDKASSTFDARQVFNLNAVYALPFGRGQRFLKSGLASSILGGWHLSGIASDRSGLPITITVSRPASALPDGNTRSTQRPDVVAGADVYPASQSTRNWLNLAAFAVPINGAWGNAGRSIARGPSLASVDAALERQFHPTERLALEARAEAFNLTNHPQFANPNANISSRASFGVITQLVNGGVTGTGVPREFEFALRLVF